MITAAETRQFLASHEYLRHGLFSTFELHAI